jgi:1,4-alpha-glucan branching enzyme
VPRGGYWTEMLNSDSTEYGGSGRGNPKKLRAEKEPMHGRPYSLALTIPPLAVMFWKSRRVKP